MFARFKSISAPESLVKKFLKRIRFVTDLILIALTIFILFQIIFIYNRSTAKPAPLISSFEDYSMIFVPLDENYQPEMKHGQFTDATCFVKTDILRGVLSPMEYLILNSKHLVLFTLILLSLFRIRQMLYSLDITKSFSIQIVESLNKLSKLIIYFSISFAVISILFYFNGYIYFQNIIQTDNMRGFIHMPSKIMTTDLVISGFIFFIGLLFKALTKFFKLGLNLQTENELTV